MAWEQRKNSDYYYRKERVGRRVTSVYHGAGEHAGLFARLDAIDRYRREAERREKLAMRENDEQIDGLLDVFAEQVDALVTATLLTNGFHQHKRQWRRKRK